MEPILQQPISPAAAESVLMAAIAPPRPRPAPGEVTQALLALESATRQTRREFTWSDIVGDWRLTFATGVRKRRGKTQLKGGYYLPSWAKAQISFVPGDRPATISVQNQAQLGPLLLQFQGPARWQGRKNLVPFEFTQVQLQIAGQTLLNRPVRGGREKEQNFEQAAIADLPFFAFFWISPEAQPGIGSPTASPKAIAARGRGGGLAVWVKVD